MAKANAAGDYLCDRQRLEAAYRDHVCCRSRRATRMCGRASLTVAIVAAVLALAATGHAQSTATPDAVPEMTADRPGFNAPAAVVGKGVVQLELGWSTARLGDRLYASSAPQPLLRVGVSRYVELQVGSDGIAAACLLDCTWQGTDVSVGARVVLPVEPLGFALAVSGGASLPTGSFDVSSEHVDPLGNRARRPTARRAPRSLVQLPADTHSRR